MAQNERPDSGRQGGSQDQDRPNQNASKEPAEGSRETVRGGQEGQQKPRASDGTGRQVGEAGAGDSDQNRKYNEGEQGAGITNRPLEREKNEQAQVPPRGQTKDKETGNA